MNVRRTLPHKNRTTIGPWCFIDHYGPELTTRTTGMQVDPHPHTGLQTVSWLFSGEIEHHDSAGNHELITPGTLAVMTAGEGIQHSEISTPEPSRLHGVQLWVVLPESARKQKPHLVVDRPVVVPHGEGSLSVFIGTLKGAPDPGVPTYWPMVGAQITLPPGGEMTLELDPTHEYGILIDQGGLSIDGTAVGLDQLAYLGPGRTSTTVVASGDARAIVLGGAPFEEPFVMWWNFIQRSHDEIVAARNDWQAGRQGGSSRFGYLGHRPALPAPELPSVVLKPRLRR